MLNVSVAPIIKYRLREHMWSGMGTRDWYGTEVWELSEARTELNRFIADFARI
jgi:hypothetical protein